MKFRKCLLVGLTLMVAMVALPQIGAAQRVFFRPYLGYGYGWGPGLYAPYYYYPSYYYPGYPATGVYSVGPRSGEVKIETHMKDASVYVDGGFAGTAGKLKEFHLQLGNHDIEIRSRAGQTLFHDKVQVLAGKTVDIRL
jgi:hypothetical protein